MQAYCLSFLPLNRDSETALTHTTPALQELAVQGQYCVQLRGLVTPGLGEDTVTAAREELPH